MFMIDANVTNDTILAFIDLVSKRFKVLSILLKTSFVISTVKLNVLKWVDRQVLLILVLKTFLTNEPKEYEI